MKTAGIVLLIIGIAGTLIFGIQAVQDTETFTFLGLDIGISSANWTPVIISGVVLLIGLALVYTSRKTTS
jgi:uncharacterized membrane protein